MASELGHPVAFLASSNGRLVTPQPTATKIQTCLHAEEEILLPVFKAPKHRPSVIEFLYA